MVVLTTVLAVVVGSALMYTISLSSMDHVQARVDNAASWSSLIRLVIIGSVAGLWRPIVQRLPARHRLDQRSVQDLLALRWRVVTWMLLLELLIAHNLIGRGLVALSGIAA